MVYMTFSVYLEEKLAARLDRTARQSGKSRNAIVREALGEWLNKGRSDEWPRAVREFRGVRSAPRFEENRKELRPPRDPFDAFPS